MNESVDILSPAIAVGSTFMSSIKNLSQAFSTPFVLNQIDFTVSKGAILALLGPSGRGKSIVLKFRTGLLRPTEGSIHFGDKLVDNSYHLIPPEQCNLGIFFQDYALRPHRTVFQSIIRSG